LVEHYAGAQQHDADAVDNRGLGGFFPVEANLGEKIVAGTALRFSCPERHEAESHLQTAEVDS
jgi:hypothetical protein